MKRILLISMTFTAILSSGYGGNGGHKSRHVKAFFGDKENNRVVVGDINNMEMIDDENTNHEITYAIDKVPDRPKVYVSNRGSNAVDIMNTNSNKIIKTIETSHYPRSADAMNPDINKVEVSGMDKAMASIIDTNTDKVILEVGDRNEKDPDNQPEKGGSHATGHPYWLTDNLFVVVDRYHKKLGVYNLNGDLVNEVQTNTSVHQLVPQLNYDGPKNTFYAIEEGSNTEYPAVIKLILTSNGLKIVKRLFLQADGVDVKDMKGHHGDFTPKKHHIYVGSAEGHVFVVDYDTMEIAKIMDAGKGAGHTFMTKNKAIVINHNDVFVSIFDLKNDTKITDARVSEADDLVGEKTLQAHPAYYLKNNKFYMVLTEEGKLIELDLDTYEVTDEIYFGGKPAMGTFVEDKRHALKKRKHSKFHVRHNGQHKQHR